jgi:sarcosine oxidase gamma subunit
LHARRLALNLAALASILATASPGCARGPGTVVVLGSGADNYYVADKTGERDLTGYKRTGTSVELPSGSYVVRLNGSRANVQVKAGKRVEVPAGSLVVSGSGADNYYVADSAGERDLTGYRRTGAVVELLPGTYMARLMGTRAVATVTGGQRTAIAAGSLIVSGSGADNYYVADSAGERDLTGYHRTSTVVELLPGTYVVRLAGTRAGATVTGGQQTAIAAGSLIVSGSGKDNYYVADSAGERDLTGYRRTGTPTELLPGAYVVRLGPRRLPVQVQPGVRAEVGP